MNYDALMTEADKLDIDIVEVKFTGNVEGLYCENTIAINKNIENQRKKTCVMAEELGHFHTSTGDILKQNILSNIKQEKKARNWAYYKLITIRNLIDAFENGITGKFELAEFLDVTEEFLVKSIEHYREKYGTYYKYNNYIIYFYPSLGILKNFETHLK